MMRNIGAYNALFLDGGPSSDMAVDNQVITDNLCSSDGGRAVGSFFMLYSTAPDDANIVRIEEDDDSERVMHVGDELKIMAWGYNQYDEMVRADVAATDEVTVTCTNNLGYWYNKKFVASQEGEGEIILTTKSGYTKRMPLAVEGRVELQISPARIFTGEGRAVQAKLWYTERGNDKEVDPTEAVWSTYNDNVLKSVTGIAHFAVQLDYNNAATYPVTVKEITSPADAKITSFKAYYGGTTGIAPVMVNGTGSVGGKDADATFTLSGQRIANGANYRGIMIQNGKKIIR